MTDKLSKEQRSLLMGRVRQRNTSPELVVRSYLHSKGYRYRLHCRNIPGTPDIVFSARHKVLFVHGCFWHRHLGCKLASNPQSHEEFWQEKFRQNIERDLRVQNELVRQGWQSLIIWECETRDIDSLRARLQKFLGPTKYQHPNYRIKNGKNTEGED